MLSSFSGRGSKNYLSIFAAGRECAVCVIINYSRWYRSTPWRFSSLPMLQAFLLLLSQKLFSHALSLCFFEAWQPPADERCTKAA